MQGGLHHTKSSSSKLMHLNLLPFSCFDYTLGNNILDYEVNEKDLGIIVNSNFSWVEQHNHDKYSIKDEAKLNSVIIHKFSGSNTKLPEHSSNDPSINPDSSIFTLSIGDSCPVTFRDKCTNATINVNTVDNSVFVG